MGQEELADSWAEFERWAHATIDRMAEAFIAMSTTFIDVAQALAVTIRHLGTVREEQVRRIAVRDLDIPESDIRAVIGTKVITWNRRVIDVTERPKERR